MSMITGFVGFSDKDVRRIELKNADGTPAGSVSITKTKKKRQKKLQYNFKQISAMILKAKTAVNARQVTVSARQTAVSLRRRLGSGEYDDRELKSAILHAEAMVRVAKKRMKHLQEEENVRVKDGVGTPEYGKAPKTEKIGEPPGGSGQPEEPAQEWSADSQELQELLREYRKIMQDMTEAAAETSENMDELAEELTICAGKDMSAPDLEALKKKHRSDELREIMEADMKYLKAMFDKLNQDREDAKAGNMGTTADMSGVVLELGGMEVPVQTVEAPAVAEGGTVDATV